MVAILQMRKLGLIEEIFVNYNARHKTFIVFTKQHNFLTLSLELFQVHHNHLLLEEISFERWMPYPRWSIPDIRVRLNCYNKEI